jgi:hypothetical protein
MPWEPLFVITPDHEGHWERRTNHNSNDFDEDWERGWEINGISRCGRVLVSQIVCVCVELRFGELMTRHVLLFSGEKRIARKTRNA